jgi:hypothetical protein
MSYTREGETACMDERLRQLRQDLANARRECDDAKAKARECHVRLNVALIRLGRAEQAAEDYEAKLKETR